MELFTLGIGTYTENDVKELARCFTGWQIRGDDGVLNAQRFDNGEKQVFGKKGHFDSEAAIDLILARPESAVFLSRHLLQGFVHPHPPDDVIAHYAQRARDLNWELKPLLGEILTSRLFFSDWAYRSKIKCPVELVVGSVAALGGKVITEFVRKQCAKLGHDLLYPPNVKGWDGEEEWINANTVLMRFNVGLAIATQRGNEFARPSDLNAWIKRHHISSAEDVLTQYSRLLLDANLTTAEHDKLLAYMNTDDKGNTRPFKLSHQTINSKVRGLLHLLMSSPEYQLA
jgi:uncharacterized protein (DUF1800 family)